MSDDTQELKDRLAKAKADRAAIANAKADREAARALADEVAAEELAARNEAAISQAECDHGQVGKLITVVDTDLGVIILRRANSLLFKRFQDSGKTTTADCDKLVRPCLVYPDAAMFDRIIDELPATMIRLANAVSVLAGVRTEEATGKS